MRYTDVPLKDKTIKKIKWLNSKRCAESWAESNPRDCLHVKSLVGIPVYCTYNYKFNIFILPSVNLGGENNYFLKIYNPAFFLSSSSLSFKISLQFLSPYAATLTKIELLTIHTLVSLNPPLSNLLTAKPCPENNDF